MKFTSSLVALVLGATAVAANAAELKRQDNPCAAGASPLCSNAQDQKDDSDALPAKVQQTTYVSGGDSSGVCMGSMGLYVYGSNDAGQPCSISGQDLINGFYEIRNSGCQTCGEVNAPIAAGTNCKIAINYVDNCVAAGHP